LVQWCWCGLVCGCGTDSTLKSGLVTVQIGTVVLVMVSVNEWN
jgi:hypothetical protein